ncbi:hypothetical protein DM02DRAFT_619801 [Periconia macrospinosa]|uniref:Cytochrome c oxidase assembly protein COX20, mitochondrial n=1 Tax=Periconia macrospinosa TaxID=97972 RepID=A0A2V1D3Q8_9PLEO|nr:hypothetical protein DM02DRAFT_619801 [Periconia macrospinosa]
MADDTRQSQQAQQPPPVPFEAPNAADVARTYKGPANTMPGGTAHTAGGARPGDDAELTYFQAVRSLPLDYYLNFHKRPCVRDGQLTGIACGFLAGSLSFILRRPVRIASNHAVGTWVITSCIHYQTCQYYRSREKDGMRQAHALMEQKRASIEQKKEARRKAREEQERLEEIQRQEEIKRKSWSYWASKNLKFW